MNKKKYFLQIVIFAVLAVLLGIFMFSCAEKSLVKVKPPKKARVGEEFVVQRSADKEPKWINEPEFQVVKEKRQKFIVVKVDVSHADRRAAERIAEGELRKRIAEGIQTLVDSQFREAMQGTNTEYSSTFESYVQTVAKEVPVVGLIVTDTYWEKIQRIKSENEVEYYYRVLKRAKMPYENYTSARDAALKNLLAKIENEAEREELRKVAERIRKQDEAM